ncbi:MAG: hypothetical protein M1825_006202 [Sarcosagium campestre]|nr:MAG: hypothetical protein M1825_006202 [Sarcosagium campestre]
MSAQREAHVTLTPLNFPDEFHNRKVHLTSPSDTIEVGRSSKNNTKNLLAAPDNTWIDSPVMSRRHAKFWISPSPSGSDELFLEDVGSMHGTFINNQRLRRFSPVAVKNDDVITFGSEVNRGPEMFPARAFRIETQWATKQPPTPESRSSFDVPEESSDDDEIDGLEGDAVISTSPVPDPLHTNSLFEEVVKTVQKPSGSPSEPVVIEDDYDEDEGEDEDNLRDEVESKDLCNINDGHEEDSQLMISVSCEPEEVQHLGVTGRQRSNSAEAVMEAKQLSADLIIDDTESLILQDLDSHALFSDLASDTSDSHYVSDLDDDAYVAETIPNALFEEEEFIDEAADSKPTSDQHPFPPSQDVRQNPSNSAPVSLNNVRVVPDSEDEAQDERVPRPEATRHVAEGKTKEQDTSKTAQPEGTVKDLHGRTNDMSQTISQEVESPDGQMRLTLSVEANSTSGGHISATNASTKLANDTPQHSYATYSSLSKGWNEECECTVTAQVGVFDGVVCDTTGIGHYEWSERLIAGPDQVVSRALSGSARNGHGWSCPEQRSSQTPERLQRKIDISDTLQSTPHADAVVAQMPKDRSETTRKRKATDEHVDQNLDGYASDGSGSAESFHGEEASTLPDAQPQEPIVDSQTMSTAIPASDPTSRNESYPDLPSPRKKKRPNESPASPSTTFKTAAKVLTGALFTGVSVFAYLAASNPDPL